MKTIMRSRTSSTTLRHGLLAALCSSLILPGLALAGGTPATGAVTDQLFVANGTQQATSIGDYVSAQLGLDEPYFFFLEVGPDVDRLVVQIFDPDILIGASATELANDRDLLRSSEDSWAQYILLDPSGNRAATRFGVGSGTGESSWDNGWITFYDSSTATITTGDTFADNFGSQVYNGSDGSDAWATDWIETGETGTVGATGGILQVTVGGELQISNAGDPSPFTSKPSLEREVDLSSYSAALLSFDWQTGGVVEDEDAAIVEVSGDGGTTWTGLDIIKNFTTLTSSGSRTYDLSGFLASDTRIRFRIFDFFAGADEVFLVDNLQILASTTTSSTSPDDGHWEVSMDFSSEVHGRAGEQNELNAYGLRAHDGTSGSGGEEVNVYATYLSAGLNSTARTRDYTYYPYITEGCEFDINDFDFDSDATDPDGVGGIDAPYGSWDLTSRLTTFTDDEGGVLSANNAWNSSTVMGWTSDNTADDYGIWQMDVTVSDFGVGNYANFYFADEGAAAPAPVASPPANSYRIYFPTDGNAAPAKPYFFQRITHAGLGNGPNPPVMGSVSRFAVTLSITNPTDSIGDITFNSSTNTISANVPGDTANARVRYGGVQTGFPTAGSIVSSPTVDSGAGGTVVWNPGTIAPGNTEVLVYFVTVEPLVATDPLSIPVTGTYASNGTIATFIDETENSTNTFSFGSLCGLNVVSGGTATATPVLVSSFTARDAGKGLMLEWQTAAEAGSARYELYRHDGTGRPVRVDHEPLLALLDAPQGGVYRFLDTDADPSQPHTYELVEVDSRGQRQRHGPFPVSAEGLAEVSGIAYERTAHLDDPAARTAQPTKAETPGERVKLFTGEAGLYRVQAADLAPLFGVPESTMRSTIRRYDLALTHGGQPVAWQRGRGGVYLEFYAEPVDSLATDRKVYFLEAGDGLPIGRRTGPRPRAEWGLDTFRDTVLVEENLRPLVLAPIAPESDIFFWDFLLAGHATQGSRTFPLTVPTPVAGTVAGELRLELQGAEPGAHGVEVWLGNTFLDEVSLTDHERAGITLPFDASLIAGGSTELRLDAIGGGLVFVDRFEITYDRAYEAVSESLLTRGDLNERIAVGGFNDGRIQVFDLSQPRRPQRQLALRRVPEGDSYRVIFRPLDSETPYLFVSHAGVLAPLAMTVDTPSDLRSTANRADYLVIAPDTLLESAGELAKHREASGFDTMVVALEDIYDEFAYGQAEPTALRDFLEWAWNHWQAAPRYVVFAGAGTYDPLDHLGYGGNLIPTRLASDGATLFSTDLPFVDLVGDDGVPEMVLGRIPVKNAAELDDYVTKVVAYEALNEPDWGHQVLMVADNADAIADFGAASAELEDLLPLGYTPTAIHLGDYPALADARQALFDALENGAVFLSYTGHGGVDRMAAEGLLTSGDVASLNNAGRPPVVVAVSCHIGLHALPTFDSLGEHLVLDGDGGAMAVWAPSWLSQHAQARFFGDRMLRHIFQSGERVLGEAVLHALEAGADLGVDPHLLRTYQLLGDPALELQLAPEPLPGGPGCGDCGGG